MPFVVRVTAKANGVDPDAINGFKNLLSVGIYKGVLLLPQTLTVYI